MRVVFDTNIFISGILWRGNPHRCLLAAEAGLCQLILAEPILDELRDKLVSKFRIPATEADEVASHFRRLSTLVVLTGRAGWIPADPKDDMSIEAAILGKAEVILSGDRHLLQLGSVSGVAILSARQFLDRIANPKTDA